MSVNKDADNKEDKKGAKPAETDEGNKTKGSAFNESLAGRLQDTTFGEKSSNPDSDGEKDILSGATQKPGPQQDADV